MIPRILFDCCDDPLNRVTWRYDVTKPFLCGDWLIGTDGRIACRVPISEHPAAIARFVDPGRRLPDVGTILRAFGYFPRSYPSIIPPDGGDRTACERCRGGEGWEWPLLPPGHPCCEACDGDGWRWKHRSVAVGEEWIASWYAALLLENGIYWLRPAVERGRSMEFNGPGFHGILMPMDPEKCKAGAACDAVENSAK